MNLDYLRTFCQVAELGSFSEVAKRLSISQPAVSFQVQKLERDLGVRLIDRAHKSVTLTDAGKRLLTFAKLVDGETARLRRDLDQLREEVTGDLVVAASTIPGEILLPPMLGEFKALHPAVGVRVDVLDSGTVIERVRDGAYQVGFCGTRPEAKELECFEVGHDEIVLIVFPEHPFAQRADVSLHELDGEPLIMREETSGTQHSLRALMAETGLNTAGWEPRLTLGTTQAIVAAVEARVGIAFVSNLAIRKSTALGLVKDVPVRGPKLSRSFFCIYRQERVVSRLLNEFIAFVRSQSQSA
ncbi:MAG: selenium metabolism-associated LysR family transcriptional regulator [Chloroflexota bacterium]|nr:selenium metabolism-associated LysR family transcriptional regulator [Chloroflexota bacterium]